MYKRILLAYDGSREGRAALREGALLARRMDAQVLFLAVVADAAGVHIAEGAYAGAAGFQQDNFKLIFEEGLARLKQLGLKPVAKMVTGQPAREIAAFAKQMSADLVVVSHRRQNMISRWWSGGDSAYLSDFLTCSLLIGRNEISDAEFEREIGRASQEQPQDADA